MTDRREEYDSVPADEQPDPADAFALLGDPLRLQIIDVLFEAGRGNPVPFSDLVDRVDVEDTGRFNYHRDQLVPRYVRKSEDGYRLTQAGERVAKAVRAGLFSESVDLPDFDVPGDCYDCGAAALRGEYVGERFRVDCHDCGNRVLNVGVPPTIARGRDPDEFVAAVQRWAGFQVDQARAGLCPDCGGAVEPGLSDPIRDTLDVDVQAVFDCAVCQRRVVTSFGTLARSHDDVQNVLRERKATHDGPFWADEHAMTGDHGERVSEDPFRYEVRFEAEGDVCTVAFDGDLQVVDVSVAEGASEGRD